MPNPSHPTITAVPGIRVGHATDRANMTGCTAVLVPEAGVRCVADVRGGAPGTRETPLLAADVAKPIYGIMLSGGSAFGLRTADGALLWLAERRVGFPTVMGPVPTVPAAIIYDLTVGNPIPPTTAMGYDACAVATDAPVECGSIGAGTGASVGKLYGRTAAMRGGIGSAAVAVALDATPCVVGALIVVNASGDVWDVHANRIIAGARDAEGWLAQRDDPTGTSIMPPDRLTNTTIGVVATDAPVSRHILTRMAISAHDGLARAVRPAHLITDGDTLFAATTATDERAITVRAAVTLAIAVERCVEAAIMDAVIRATTFAQIAAARDIRHRTKRS